MSLFLVLTTHGILVWCQKQCVCLYVNVICYLLETINTKLSPSTRRETSCDVQPAAADQSPDDPTEDLSQQTLPVLEPGDQLLIACAPDLSKSDTPDAQKRNVLNKITDRGKDIISIIYPPYEEEKKEKEFDDSERKKAEKYALSTDQVLLTDALGLPVNLNRRVSKPTPLAQVIEGRVVTEKTRAATDALEGNSKLWIGKDYTNFIVKDFNNLDLPFVGEFVVQSSSFVCLNLRTVAMFWAIGKLLPTPSLQ